MATSTFYADNIICSGLDCTSVNISGSTVDNVALENSTISDCKYKSGTDEPIVIDTSLLSVQRTITYPDASGTVALQNANANFVDTTMASLVVNSYLGPTNDGIIINGNNVGFANGLLIKDLGTPKFAIQTNPGSGESYLNSIVGPLKFLVGNAERLRILNTGIPLNNTLTNMLALNGTTLSYRNDIMDTSTAQVVTAIKTFSPGIKCTSILDNSGTNNVQINSDIAVNISNAVTLTNKTINIDNQTSLISTRSFGSMAHTAGTGFSSVVTTLTYVVCPAPMSIYSTANRNVTVIGGNTLNDSNGAATKNYLLSYTFCGSYSVNNQMIYCKLRANNGTVDVPGSLCVGSAGNANNICCVSSNNITYQSTGATNFQLWITLSSNGTLTTQYANVTLQTLN